MMEVTNMIKSMAMESLLGNQETSTKAITIWMNEMDLER